MTPSEKRLTRAKLLLIFAAVSLAFGLWATYRRSNVAVDGTIAAATPKENGANYQMTATDGSKFDFAVDGTDTSLPKDLPVGTHVTKNRGELTWLRNGAPVSDFPILTYLGLPAVLFIFGAWSFLRYRPRPEASAPSA